MSRPRNIYRAHRRLIRRGPLCVRVHADPHFPRITNDVRITTTAGVDIARTVPLRYAGALHCARRPFFAQLYRQRKDGGAFLASRRPMRIATRLEYLEVQR